MKISVITINYNNKGGLIRTAKSVLEQTWRDFEWIIIDGGSTDGSKEVIEELVVNPKSNIAYWCSEKDNGIYNAMNKGVSHAHGEYCQLLNSGDSFYCPTVLEQLMKDGINADIVVGDTMLSSGELFTVPEKVTLKYFIHASLGHSSSFSKRELLLENPFDESLKIVSDMKFFLTSIVFRGASYEKKNIIMTRFELDGVSSKMMELKKKERVDILNSLFPRTILDDYYRFLGDTDSYYNFFTTVSRSRFKWVIYNISLFFAKMLMLNRGWIKNHHFHF